VVLSSGTAIKWAPLPWRPVPWRPVPWGPRDLARYAQDLLDLKRWTLEDVAEHLFHKGKPAARRIYARRFIDRELTKVRTIDRNLLSDMCDLVSDVLGGTDAVYLDDAGKQVLFNPDYLPKKGTKQAYAALQDFVRGLPDRRRNSPDPRP